MTASHPTLTHRTRRKEPGMTNRKFLKVSDVCAELDIARSTFFEWRAKNRGPRTIKLPNGELRIRRTELDKFLAEHEEDAAA